MKRPAHIAVVGGSGSGKTWLAGKIAARLGSRAAPVMLDDFYRDLSHVPRMERDATNFDDPAMIDWEEVGRVMGAMRVGREIDLPAYDFTTHTRQRQRRTFAPPPLVVWDGLWLLHHDRVREQFALSIFIDCGVEERFRRRAERDERERGRTRESVREQFFTQVEPMHGRYVEPQRPRAARVLASPAGPAELERLLVTLSGLEPK